MPDCSDKSRRYPRCILGTCCIPWTADYQLDEAIFRRAIHQTVTQGTKHLYIFGTAGEGYAVSDAQFDLITRIFADEMAGAGGIPMVGVISLSTGHAIERIERAAAMGVREFQISLPSWGACTPVETRSFFDAICGRFPALKFVHYNVARAGRMIEPAEYHQLVNDHANLVAVKFATDSLRRVMLLKCTAPQLRIFFTEFAFAWGCLAGVEPGLLISLASICWPRAHEYFRAGESGDATALLGMAHELLQVSQRLHELNEPLSHMDGAYDGLLLKMNVPEFPLRLLPPYQTTSEQVYQAFRDMVRTQFPQWLSATPSVASI
ncbi:MAG: dihydrodipicolinate synthase family protein [Phycisphaeraceae bacterium]|nr:dihydrodipicolinate synthase family protein [Phycisphaeraceae bacterium]